MEQKIRRLAFKTKLGFIKAWYMLKDAGMHAGKLTIKAARKAAFLAKKTFKLLFKGLGLISDDILLIAGIVCVARGVFMIYVPAGYIVLGLCLFGLAYLVAHRKAMARR